MATYRMYVTTLLVVLGLAAAAQAQTFTTLYNFSGGSDGAHPEAAVIQDSSGNLYGTTYWGGCNSHGVVFEVNTAGGETVLYNFCKPKFGASPAAPVTRDEVGSLYGTTNFGGSGSNGTVFKIDTAGNETVLYSFIGETDGCYPQQGVVRDNAGNLYGTTSYCGPHRLYGTIFKLDSAGNLTVLYSFRPSDGGSPRFGHLTMDDSGNLYGVTIEGGVSGYGTLYKVSTNGTFRRLYSFAGGTSDGCDPVGSVLLNKAGNLYGTTSGCGSNGYGTIWKVSKTGKETILHNFAGGGSDGCWPEAGVTPDSEGNLYGVTVGCGASDYGTLYKLSASGRLALLHSFDAPNGAGPEGEVLRTATGTLFGATYNGGSQNCQYGCGTVWEYVP